MALIHIIRDVPEYKGGALEADIPEQDYPILNARGWRKAEGKAPSKPLNLLQKRNLKSLLKKTAEKTVFKGGTK